MRDLNEQKFCSWCGGNTVYKEKWISVCQTCEYTNYLNHKPCCNIILVHQGRVLMLERSIEPRKGFYDLPGGFMDMTDDRIEDACYREISEEIGLEKNQISTIQYVGSSTEHYEWQNTKLRNLCMFFSAEIEDKDLISLDEKENSSYKWVSRDDLVNIQYAWSIDREMLSKYFQENK